MPSKKTKIVHNKKVKLYRNKKINSIIFLNSTKNITLPIILVAI